MFLVNSRFPLVCATPSSSGREVLHPDGVLLLPKLRRHFAEFLNHSSPDRLGILYLPTCVGLGYGHRDNSPLGFSRQYGISDFALIGSASRLSVWLQLSSEPTYSLTPGQPSPGITYPSASPFGYPPPVGRFAIPKDGSPLVPGFGLDAVTVVPEYQPVVHRLRLSASP